MSIIQWFVSSYHDHNVSLAGWRLPLFERLVHLRARVSLSLFVSVEVAFAGDPTSLALGNILLHATSLRVPISVALGHVEGF